MEAAVNTMMPAADQSAVQDIRLLVDTIPAMAWSVRPDGCADFFNHRWLEYTGLTQQQALDSGWKTAVHPDDLRGLLEVFQEVANVAKGFEVEGRLRRFDGEYRWFVFRGNPLCDESGKVVKWYGANIDLEAKKRAEQALREAMAERMRLDAVRAEVGMGLARKDTLSRMLHTCADAMVHHLDAAFARIWTLSSDGLYLELQASAGMYTRLDGRYSRIPFGRFKIGLIAQEKKPHLTNDVPNDPRIDSKEWARNEGMISFAGYPLVAEDRIVGVMGMFSRKVLTQNTLDTLAFIAGGIAQGIERKRVEDALRASELNLRLMIDSLPGLIATMNAAGEVEFVNQPISDFFGRTAEELQDWAPLIHPDDREHVVAMWRHSIETGVPYETVQRLLGLQGYRWFNVRGLPLRDEKGRIIQWYFLLTDIEDQKRSEQALKDQLQKENVALREEVDRVAMFEEIVGSSPALNAVLSRVAKVAPTDSTVLITGETGTGKELIARAIHKQSQRAQRAFVSVNCAALAPSLIASELFGHEKGAFTGAVQRRIGRFELADGGTLFLDEVGELPLDTQVAFLRALQEREFERVGGKDRIQVDVRIIGATNRNLQAAIPAGTFRSDLFYRLNVFPIEVPPLRQRREDVLVLLEYFVHRFARAVGKSFTKIDKQTLKLFQTYEWPGNIRELQNVVERSVIVSSDDTFCVDEAWLSRAGDRTKWEATPETAAEYSSDERQVIEAALAECRGRVSGPKGAASRLGVPPSTLDSRIKKLKINKQRFKLG